MPGLSLYKLNVEMSRPLLPLLGVQYSMWHVDAQYCHWVIVNNEGTWVISNLQLSQQHLDLPHPTVYSHCRGSAYQGLGMQVRLVRRAHGLVIQIELKKAELSECSADSLFFNG